MINIRKLESELWESADLLRAGSKLTSNQYCMPVLGLIFLRYAYSRYKMVEAEILKGRPSRGGRVMPVEASDFAAKSALYLPKEAQYDYLLNLPEDISAAGLVNRDGHNMNSLGEVVNNAMLLIEDQSEQLVGVLPKSYTDFSDEILSELLRIFNNSALDEVGGDIIGRIYEYFLNKFAKNIASDDGVFFTPKSLVKMIVNIIEPTSGVLLESKTQNLIQINDCPLRGVAQDLGVSVLQTGAFLYIGDVVMATITKKQMEEYERLRRDRDNGRLLTPDGLRLICAAYENDPEKIGIHMLEMLAKFRNEGIID